MIIGGLSTANCGDVTITHEKIILAISARPIPQEIKTDVENFSDGKIDLKTPDSKKCLEVANSCYMLGELNSSERIYLHLINLSLSQDDQLKEKLSPVVSEAWQGLTHLYYQAGRFDDAILAATITQSTELYELITYSAYARGWMPEKGGLTLDFVKNKVHERYRSNEAYLLAYLRVCLRSKVIPRLKISKVAELEKENAVKVEMIYADSPAQKFALNIGIKNLSTLYYLMGDYAKSANWSEKLFGQKKLPPLEALSQAILFSRSKKMLGDSHFGPDFIEKIRTESGKLWTKIKFDALMEADNHDR